MKQMPNSTVRPVHFEDFGGAGFERLVFAYHVRIGCSELAWYGQTGSDQGRDIIGVEPVDAAADGHPVRQPKRADPGQGRAGHGQGSRGAD